MGVILICVNMIKLRGLDGHLLILLKMLLKLQNLILLQIIMINTEIGLNIIQKCNNGEVSTRMKKKIINAILSWF